MREYGFSLTHILQYKDKIEYFVLMRQNTGQWKPVFSYILCSEISEDEFLIYSCYFFNNLKSNRCYYCKLDL